MSAGDSTLGNMIVAGSVGAFMTTFKSSSARPEETELTRTAASVRPKSTSDSIFTMLWRASSFMKEGKKLDNQTWIHKSLFSIKFYLIIFAKEII